MSGDDESTGEILEEVRAIVAEDEGESNGGTPPVPRLAERGLGSVAPGLAVMIPGFLLSLLLQDLLVAILELPATATASGEDGLFVVVFPWVFIVPDARPARAAQWAAIAGISAAYFVTAVVTWACAGAVLFSLAPGLKFGIDVAMLLGGLGAVGGLAAYRLIHRLAGRASPWWDETDERRGKA